MIADVSTPKTALVSRFRSILANNQSPATIEQMRRAAVLLNVSLPIPVLKEETTDFSVQNIPFDQIHIDKARFQPRDDFSEEKVQEIVQNFNPALFKPLIVWKDPKDGKIYILAGHHRYEALKRMGRKSAPVVFAEGDEQKAVELAWTENQSGRSQTAAENAKYLRKLALSGRTKGEIQTECKRLYDRSCQVALDLSFLNPRGKALVDLGLLQRDSETFKDQETMAQWIGKLRGRFPELTDSHENEVYDYLRQNYKIKGRKFTNSADFLAFMENLIIKRMNFGEVPERLDIDVAPVSAVALEYDEQIKQAEKELAQALDVFEKQFKASNERKFKGEITEEQRKAGLQRYEDAVTIAQREVLRLNEAKGKGVKEARESEMSLFGLGDASVKTFLLSKWNSSSLTDTQREQVRRAATLLGVDLPERKEIPVTQTAPKENYYIHNKATGKLELYFSKAAYQALPEEIRSKIKRYFLFSRSQSAWVSKERRDLYAPAYPEQIAQSAGLVDAGKKGTRKSFAEQQEEKQERREHKAEYAEQKAEKLEKESNRLYSEAKKGYELIPFGQPIHYDHYSAKWDRNYRDKLWNKLGKSFELQRKSAYYAERAERLSKELGNQNYDYWARRIKESEKRIREMEKDFSEILTFLNFLEENETKESAIAAIDAQIAKLFERYQEEPRHSEKRRNTERELDVLESRKKKFIELTENWSEYRERRIEKIKEGLDNREELLDIETDKLTYYQEQQERIKGKMEAVGLRVYDSESLKDALYVLYRGDWHKLIKLNPTTATISWISGGSTKAPYEEIRDAVYSNTFFNVKSARPEIGTFTIEKVASAEEVTSPHIDTTVEYDAKTLANAEYVSIRRFGEKRYFKVEKVTPKIVTILWGRAEKMQIRYSDILGAVIRGEKFTAEPNKKDYDGSFTITREELLSDHTNRVETFLLAKWNSSSLTDTQREQVRRAAVLLNVDLPTKKVPFERFNTAFWTWFANSKVVDKKGKPLRVYHGTQSNFTAFSKKKLGLSTEATSAKLGFFFAGKPITTFSYSDTAYYTDQMSAYEKIQRIVDILANTNDIEQTIKIDNDDFDILFKVHQQEWSIKEYSYFKKGNFLETQRIASAISYLKNRQNGIIEKLEDYWMGMFEENYQPQTILAYLSLQNPLEYDFSKVYDIETMLITLLQKAKQQKHDGAIFRNVKLRFGNTEKRFPDTIYVVFEPNQIKSAIGNDGTWDANDDNILSDHTNRIETFILAKWNDSSLSTTQREQVRRAAVLLGITLPNVNVSAVQLPDKSQERPKAPEKPQKSPSTPHKTDRSQESPKTTSGYPPRPEAVTESAELIPQPEIFFPKGKYAISDDAYMACNLALTRYKNGGRGFLLADGTGFGKTRQILVIAHEYQQMTGGDVLIVTENESIIQGNFKKDQEALRIVNPKVEITTYTKVADGLFKDRAFALVAFDEAHNLKNSDSLKTIASNKLTTNHTLFATATPMDTVVGSAYFISAVTNIPKNQVFSMLGFRVETKTIDGQSVQKIVLDKNTNFDFVKKNIVKVRQDMIESGAMVRRVFPFYGEVRSIMIPLTEEQRQEDDQIWDEFENQIEEAKENFAFTKAMNLAGQRSGELSRLNEPRKIQTAYDLVKEELAKGKQVVVIAEGINTTTISAINKTVRGTIETLVERLKRDGIGVSEGYGANKSAKVAAIADFQRGKNKVIIGTPQSISTGIDLDDQRGNAPRTLIMVTASYSGNTFQQILGRVSRRNTLSPAEVIILYTDSMSDRRRKEIVDKKLEVLRLIQSGKAVMEAEETEGLEQSVSKIQGGTREESSENITRGVAVTESGGRADVSIKPHGNALLVYGNTFPFRETLKNLGGRWNATLKGWIFPPSKMDVLQTALNLSPQQPETAVLAPIEFAPKTDIFLVRSGNQFLHLKGNTKRVDKEIREAGGVWNMKAKAWQFPSWRKNELEAKLGIKLWEDSSEQMTTLRDTEDEFLQEWFEEENISLQENDFSNFESDVMPNAVLRERLHIDTSVPEVYAATLSVPLPEREIQLLALHSRIKLGNVPASVPFAHLMDSSRSSLAKFQGDWWDGQHHFEQGIYSLHLRLNNSSAWNRAVFWHEYAHHLLDTLPIRQSQYWEVFLATVKNTPAWKEACWYDEIEMETGGKQYWTLEKELWARAASQYFLVDCRDWDAVRILQDSFIAQWETSDFFIVAEDVYALLHEVNLVD